MARMTAARAAVEILKREGVTSAWVGLRHSQRRLGCKAIRVTDPADLGAAFEEIATEPEHAPTSIRTLKV
jgi:glyoxylate carboligase